MITPVQAALRCQAIYADSPEGFAQVVDVAGIRFGVSDIDGIRSITFRGSKTPEDWLRDLAVIPEHATFEAADLGILHYGFFAGMTDAFRMAEPFLTGQGQIAILGHSLGCAHAAYLAGMCLASGIPVDQLLLFAPPRMSYTTLPRMLNARIPDLRAWHNGLDPVPMVPVYVPLFAPWVNIAPHIDIHMPPSDPLDLFSWHAIELYLQGVTP